MREKQLEQKLTQATRARGGQAWKLVSPSTAGVPDRLILLPHGKTGFVEVKAPGQKPRPIQTRRLRQLRALGHQAWVIDHPSQIGDILDAIQATRLPD